MKSKIIVVCVAIAILALAVFLNEKSHDPMAWCFKDKSKCAYDAMLKYRDIRDATDASLDKQKIDNKAYYDPIINSFKPMLDGETISNELKAGRKENVPEGILSFRVVPQAMAASGETMIDTSQQVRFAPNQVNTGRYGKVLAEIGSPYASVPIEKYCNTNGLNERQCDLLVGIAQAESQNGTDYACRWKTWEQAVKLGQEYYHNPTGFKDFTDDGIKKNPDINGCWLKRFDSFGAFWEFYVPHMIQSYYWKNVTDVTYLSGCYVKGKDEITKKCLSPALEWTGIVQGFADRIASSNS